MRLRPRTKIARRLRHNATDAEARLWRVLRQIDLGGRARRQHPVGRHVVDFAIPAVKLAIEIDGGQHAARYRLDCRRSAEIAKHGYRVLRFWNNEVIDNLEGVLQAIRSEAGKYPRLTPPLSTPGGGEGEE